MILSEQIRVIFYSFIYGMFFLTTLNYYKKIKINKKFLILFDFIFLICHISLFYYLLYKINSGMLSLYIGICFVAGCFFCQFLYFNDKKS